LSSPPLRIRGRAHTERARWARSSPLPPAGQFQQKFSAGGAQVQAACGWGKAAQVRRCRVAPVGSRSGRRGGGTGWAAAIRSPAPPATSLVVRFATGQPAGQQGLVATALERRCGRPGWRFFLWQPGQWVLRVPTAAPAVALSGRPRAAAPASSSASPQERKPDAGRPWAVAGRATVSIRAASLCRSLRPMGLCSRSAQGSRADPDQLASAWVRPAPFAGAASQARAAVRPGARRRPGGVDVQPRCGSGLL